MTIARKLFGGAGALLLMCVALIAGTRPTTPQTNRQLLQNNLELKLVAGDINAARQLYNGGFYAGTDAQMGIALRGAALGDWTFQKLYFDNWLNHFSKKQRSESLKIERRFLAGHQAQCYLDMLEQEVLTHRCIQPASGTKVFSYKNSRQSQSAGGSAITENFD